MRSTTPKWLALWVIAMALCASLASAVWSLEVPGGGAAPDEQAHLAVANYVADHGTMPKLGDPGFGITFVPVRVHGLDFPNFPYQPYATHPPGAYVFSAMWLATGVDDDAANGFRWSRTSQFLLAGFLTALAFAASRAMFPTRPVAWVATTTIVATWPGLTFLFAYLNPDGLAAVAGAAVVFTWFRGAARGWRLRDLGWLGAALALVVLSKPTAWILIPLTLVVLAITARPTLRRWLQRAAVALGVMSLIAGPWIVTQMRRYNGDVTGIFVQRDAVRASGATPIDGATYGVSYWELLTDFHWLTTTTRTFVLAIPTHHTTLLELSALALCALASIAAALRVLARDRRIVRQYPLHSLSAIAIVVLAVVASVNAWRGDIVFQGQGRYLYPVIVPSIAFAVVSSIVLMRSWVGAAVLTAAASAVALVAVHSLRAAYAGASASTFVTYVPTCTTIALGLAAVVVVGRRNRDVTR